MIDINHDENIFLPYLTSKIKYLYYYCFENIEKNEEIINSIIKYIINYSYNIYLN